MTIRFHYCISLFVFTWYRQSEPVPVRPGQSLFLAALPYNLITVLLGWWGLPWGIFLTLVAILKNLSVHSTSDVQLSESS